jgi:hypothetical protein
MVAFIKPRYLIRVILSLIIKKNQKHESDKVELYIKKLGLIFSNQSPFT